MSVKLIFEIPFCQVSRVNRECRGWLKTIATDFSSVLGIALLTIAGLAQSTDRASAQETEEDDVDRQIQLTVVDEDANPIAGVSVMLKYLDRNDSGTQDAQASGKTTEEGEYVLDVSGSTIRSLEINCEANGMTPYRIHYQCGPREEVEFPFQRKIVLKSGRTIHGRVIDHLGNPVRNAVGSLEINSQEVRLGPIHSYRLEFGNFVSDELGNFAIENVPTDPGLNPIVIMDHPDFPGPTETELVQVGGSVIVRMPKAASVSGIVLDESGRPVESAVVRVGQSYLAESLPLTRTNEEGRFRLTGMFPGTTLLTVDAEGHAPRMIDIDLNVDVPMNVEVTLESGRQVSGKVLAHSQAGGS